MYCLTCGYALAGLNAGPCPECGRRFDPAHRRSWADADRAGMRRLVGRVAILAAPGMIWGLGATALTFGCAWLSLGHRPIPMFDDPKYISTPVSVIGFIAELLLLASISFPPISIGCAIAAGVIQRRWMPWTWVVLAALLAVAATIVWIRQDPLRILEWYGD